LTLALAGGALRVLGGALTQHIFPVNYAWQNFFSPPWGCRCTHCTPGYAYEYNVRKSNVTVTFCCIINTYSL